MSTNGLTKGLAYGLTKGIASGFLLGPQLDPDAAAYISAITSAGATVSPTQSAAVNAFVISEKLADRWSSLRRLYFPIWGVAAANAICMKSLTSGVFSGSVTHSAGFVQGDGTNGKFSTSATLSSMGITSRENWIGFLMNDTPVTANTSLYYADFFLFMRRYASGNTIQVTSDSGNVFWAGQTGNAILSTVSTTESGLRFYQRTQSARTLIGSSLNVSAIRFPSVIDWMGNATHGFNNKKHGSFWVGLPVSDDGDSAFTSNLKTLWETCTGLTLP